VSDAAEMVSNNVEDGKRCVARND